MKPDNEDNCSMALYSIKEIFASLSCVTVFSNDPNDIKNDWEGIVGKIMTEVMNDLKMEHMRIDLTERIFFNLATASSKTFYVNA